MIKPETVGAWMFNLGGRRFIMAGGGGITGAALFAWGRLSESGLLSIFAMTIGAYLTANTIAEVMNGKKDKPDVPTP